MYETVFFDAKELSWLQGRDNCARKLLEEGHKESSRANAMRTMAFLHT